MRKVLFFGLTLLVAAAAPLQLRPQAQAPPKSAASAAASAITNVVVDAAHGGPDSGARGPQGTMESDIVLDFARAVRVAVEAQGLHVKLTRGNPGEDNQDPSFDDRSATVNGLRDAVFISLHVSSTGPVGTARAYYYVPAASPPSPAKPSEPPPASPRRPGIVEWDRAQEPFVDSSRQLAELVQTQLAAQFKGSPETPLAAPLRQLRTIAAPAIAIEISNIAVGDPQQLAQMDHPLAEAVAAAVAAFRQALAGGAPAAGEGR